MAKFSRRVGVHALIIGLALTGEVHLLSGEAFHDYAPPVKACDSSHGAGAYFHVGEGERPFCPLCQIVRTGSVRPATQVRLEVPQSSATYLSEGHKAAYALHLRGNLRPRSPPLA